MNSLLKLKNVNLKYQTGNDTIKVLKNINLETKKNESISIVGESGSGKSLTARAVMGLLPAPHVRVGKGEIIFGAEDLTKVTYERLRELRGSEISMIFQEPMTALNPVHSVGRQIMETFFLHFLYRC